MANKQWAGAAALAALILATAAWPQSSEGAPAGSEESMRRQEDSELGVSISGTAHSEYLRSALSGDSAALAQPTRENIAFTRADIDLIARPSAHTRGRLLFRVHQDWQNYYDEGPNPLTARWFDYRGNILGDRVEFAIGDFREKLSPLTLYSPEPEFLYEPEIFADRRQRAMDEWFLGDNRLPLQGLHAVYRQPLGSALRLETGATGARLRGTAPSAAVSWTYWTDDVEKFLGAGFVNLRAFDAFEVGGTYLQIIDRVSSSRAKANQFIRLTPTSIYEDVAVTAGHAGFDAAYLLGNPNLVLRADAEVAMSNYRPMRDVKDSIGTQQRIIVDPATGRQDTSYIPVFALKLFKGAERNGKAMRASFQAGYEAGTEGFFGIDLRLAYLRNEKDYINDVAQSPTFVGTRILNAANGVGGFQRGYNTFDALYNQAYSVDPVTRLNNLEYYSPDTKTYNGTNNWYRSGNFKSSYTNATSTRSELEAQSRLDPHVQLLYPFGPATPNRDGLDVNLTFSLLGGKLEATALYAGLKELVGQQVDSTTIAEPATYGRVGGGMSVQAGKLLGLSKRVTLSGSLVRDFRKQAGYSLRDTAYGATDFQTAMINAGAYAGIWKGLALIAGYQQIASNPLLGYSLAGTSAVPRVGDMLQGHWSAGLEIRLGHGAYVTGEYGRIDLKETATGTRFAQDVSSLGLFLAF